MPIIRHVAVVFRIAAGPRLGFGHLVRCRALARALGVVPRVSIRGTAATRRAAARLGARVLDGGPRLLGRERPHLLVVDDPSAIEARRWVSAARRRGIPVASIHDAGLARVRADLVIDGSVRTAPSADATRLFGPRYAVIDPRLSASGTRRRAVAGRVVVAVGGGAHVFSLVPAVVAALARRVPGLDIRVAAGFTPRPLRPALPAGRWLAPGQLGRAMSNAHLAIVAGGITAYEACALGVPAVAVSVVPAQQPTVRALARRGAAVDGGPLGTAAAASRVAGHTSRLLASPAAQRRLAANGRCLVDGRGAARVAVALRALARAGGPRG
ncbi:MAG: hypothetical protein JNL48_09795 [Acidobacteria bacterium]|nr:hypothetical protein [Acidobacteriota bacterium]